VVEENALNLTIFLSATFAAAVITGLVGFAFGLVAAATWLHILSPLQTATLIIAFGLVVQGYSVWKLRQALQWQRLWPFLVGAALGVPLGVAVLRWTRPDIVRTGVGVILILFSVYSFVRPAMKPVKSGGALADGGVGFANGVLGSITGFAGILTIIWCGVRGWPRDEQRAVFQPIGVAIFAMSALWLGASGTLSTDTMWLFVIGLPVLLLGTLGGPEVVRPPQRSRLSARGSAVAVRLRHHARHLNGRTNAMTINIATMPLGIKPSGFTAALTGQGEPVRWEILEDASASGGKVIAETSQDSADYRFPLCIFDDFTARDVEVSVRFKAVDGQVDQAAGLIARVQDPQNYYVARANALEANVRLYKVTDGVRRQIAGHNIEVASGIWHNLSLKLSGDILEVAFDDAPLIQTHDATIAVPGKVGLWTKADSLTHFADFAFRPLPAEADVDNR